MKTDDQIFANQHFVPQFYLRLFSDDKKTISLFNKFSRQKTGREYINNIASEKGLYDFEYSEHKLTSEIEAKLSVFERKAAPLIKKYIAKPADFINMPDSEKVTLSRFFGVQYVRTLKFRKFQENRFDFTIKQDIALAEAEKGGTNAEAEIKNMMDMPIFFMNHSQATLQEMMYRAKMVKQALYNRNWTLVETKYDTFITSDSPMARLIYKDGSDEFMIALGPRLVLMMELQRRPSRFFTEEADPFAVMSIFQKAYKYNEIMCKQSYLEIYGQSKLIDDVVARYQPKFSKVGIRFTDFYDEIIELHEENFPIDVFSNSDIQYYRMLYGR